MTEQKKTDQKTTPGSPTPEQQSAAAAAVVPSAIADGLVEHSDEMVEVLEPLYFGLDRAASPGDVIHAAVAKANGWDDQVGPVGTLAKRAKHAAENG